MGAGASYGRLFHHHSVFPHFDCPPLLGGYNGRMDDYALLHQPAKFVRALEAALAQPLPGRRAHQRMACAHRQWMPDFGVLLRQSAVLALFYPSQAGMALPFTLRPAQLAHHGGQVSFPGGGKEAVDASLVQTALRETSEELGITTENVRVLGSMTSLYIASSQNMVKPFVGWIPSLPPLHPDAREVAKVLTIPLRTLLDPATRDTYAWRNNGHIMTVPSYRVAGVHIWGATAMMVSELIEVISGILATCAIGKDVSAD